MKTIAFFLLLTTGSICYGQEVTNVIALSPEGEYENVKVHKMYSDEHVTTFVIWVKEGVKAHLHEFHSETLYVVEGSGDMTIDQETVSINPGDLFTIPENTEHAVTVTSEGPLKVISVQTPEFLGKDRKFLD